MSSILTVTTLLLNNSFWSFSVDHFRLVMFSFFEVDKIIRSIQSAYSCEERHIMPIIRGEQELLPGCAVCARDTVFLGVSRSFWASTYWV